MGTVRVMEQTRTSEMILKEISRFTKDTKIDIRGYQICIPHVAFLCYPQDVMINSGCYQTCKEINIGPRWKQ